MCPDNELGLSEEFLDPNESSEHDRARHHARKETFKSCHCGDETTNSRRPKGKNKGKGSGKRDEKKLEDDDGAEDQNMVEDADEN